MWKIACTTEAGAFVFGWMAIVPFESGVVEKVGWLMREVSGCVGWR